MKTPRENSFLARYGSEKHVDDLINGDEFVHGDIVQNPAFKTEKHLEPLLNKLNPRDMMNYSQLVKVARHVKNPSEQQIHKIIEHPNSTRGMFGDLPLQNLIANNHVKLNDDHIESIFELSKSTAPHNSLEYRSEWDHDLFKNMGEPLSHKIADYAIDNENLGLKLALADHTKYPSVIEKLHDSQKYQSASLQKAIVANPATPKHVFDDYRFNRYAMSSGIWKSPKITTQDIDHGIRVASDEDTFPHGNAHRINILNHMYEHPNVTSEQKSKISELLRQDKEKYGD